MSLIGAAAVSGASGLLGGLINKIGQKKTEQRQVKYQKELADYQYSKDLDMWSKSNEYNKPGAQMARLKEAGLNPHLVYGSGSAVGNTAPASSPKYQNPGTQFKNVPAIEPNAMLGNYMALKNLQNQTNSVKAQNDLTEQKTISEMLQQAIHAASAKKLNLDITHQGKLFEHSYDIQRYKAQEGYENIAHRYQKLQQNKEFTQQQKYKTKEMKNTSQWYDRATKANVPIKGLMELLRLIKN